MGVATYIKDEKDAIKEVTLQSDIKIKPIYTPDDLERIGFDYQKDLADPGEFPFTRGIHPMGFRSRNWTTRQYTGFGTPEETNERFKLMLHSISPRRWAMIPTILWQRVKWDAWVWPLIP
jgi:methylmalonyl-CoA mutase N-terminal domain/subunit